MSKGTLATAEKMARAGNARQIAEAGERAIAKSRDVRELREIEATLGKLKRIVAEVTGKRVDVNRIAVPMVRAAVKGGRLLTEMAAKGERAGKGNRKQMSHGATFATLPELGFSRSRASRWQLAGEFPDEMFKALEKQVNESDDELWSLSHVWRAARHWKRDLDLVAQRQAIAAGEFVQGVGPYDVIVVDPPWPYDTQASYDVTGWRGATPYPEMTLEQIAADGDAEIVGKAAPDCILWLWTTHRFMRHSFPLLDRWGFRDVQILTWVKSSLGLGSWLRSKSEFAIMAVRGEPKVRLKAHSTVLEGTSREHSRKPDEFYELVEDLCVGVRRYDRFAREPRTAWDVAGNTPNLFEAATA